MKRYWINFTIAVDGKPFGTGVRGVMREQTIQHEQHLSEVANALADIVRADLKVPEGVAIYIQVTNWTRFEEPELEIVSSMAGLRAPAIQ